MIPKQLHCKGGGKVTFPCVATIHGTKKAGYFNPSDKTKEYEFISDGDGFLKISEAKEGVLCTYDITSTTEPSTLCYTGYTFFSSTMLVDGIETTSSSAYSFSTTGEHTVKFLLDENLREWTRLPHDIFDCRFIPNLTSVVVPKSITVIEPYVFTNSHDLSVTITNPNTDFPYSSSFSELQNLNLTIPGNIKNLNSECFNKCTFSEIHTDNRILYNINMLKPFIGARLYIDGKYQGIITEGMFYY